MKPQHYIRTTLALAAAMAGIALFSHSANAAVVFTDSFESGGIPPMGWTTSGGVNFQTRGGYGTLLPTHGSSTAWLNGPGHGGPSVWRGTGVSMITGTIYTLKVDLGSSFFPDTENVTIRLYDVSVGTGTPLAQIIQSGSPVDTWFYDQTVSYTATAAEAGKELGIFLVVNSGTQVELDNIRIEATAVPEPGRIGLLALAGLGFLSRRRR